jgi:hypothetical protein
MAGKARNVSKKETAIEEQLEEIKGCLKKQDEEMNKSLWRSLSAAIGLPIFLVGSAGWGGVKLVSNPNFAAQYWLIFALFGAVVILIGVIGVSMVAKVSQRNSTIAKK